MNPQDNPQPNPGEGQAPVVDQAAIEAKAEERAKAIAAEQIEKMKEDLATSLTGKEKAAAPKSWDELESRIGESATEKATRTAVEEARKIIAEDKKQAEEKQNLTLKQQEDNAKAEWTRMSQEWSEAVTDGIIPDIATEVKAKLKSGVKFEDLSQDEQNDPGLKAYNDARLLHVKLRQEGKSNSFYRTVQKFYNKMPAGAGAPVLGGGTPPAAQSDDYTYEQIEANRKQKFGW